MAEIQASDLISEGALQAPLKLAENYDRVIASINKLLIVVNKYETSIGKDDSIPKMKKNTDGLGASLTELDKIQKQYASSTQKLSDEYISNKKALEAVNAEVRRKVALGDAEAKEIDAKKASLKQLEAALNANRTAYANLAGEQARNSKEGKELLEIIQKQDKQSKELSGSLGQMQKNVGNYADGMKAVAPAASSFLTNLISITKAAWAFVMTPLGAVITVLVGAFSTLIAYFKSSEEGQNRLNKIMLIGKSVIEQLKNFVEDFGEALYNAFTDPKQAMIDFWEFLKSQIVNRFVGILELIPKIGEAMKLLFQGKFSEAAEVAGDAVGKVVLGIEHATDKIKGFVSEVVKATAEGIRAGKEMADLQAKIDRDERKLIVERQRLELEVSKIRDAAIKVEGEAKRKLIEEAIRLEQQLSNIEVQHAQDKLKLAKLEAKNNGDDKEALDKIANAEADVLKAVAIRYDGTKKFAKELEALENAEEARKKKVAEDEAKRWKDKMEAAAKQKAADEKALKDKLAADKKANLEHLNEEKSIADAKAGLAMKLGGVLKDVAGKNRELTIGAILIEKAAAIGQIVASTAIANAKAIAASPLTLGMPWVAINTASGALSIASTVASAAQAIADMPKFYKGTKSAPGGAAVVGEQGIELMGKDGKWSLSPASATIMNIAKGTEIIPHKETMKILAMSALRTERGVDNENATMVGVFSMLNTTIRDSNKGVQKAIERSNSVLIRQGSLLYEMKEQANGNKKLVRLKSFSR